MASKTPTMTLRRSKNKISRVVGTSFAPKHKINLLTGDKKFRSKVLYIWIDYIKLRN